jgi:hypothetical protein
MGLRFRKSIKLLPGLRINFGLQGISATVGVRGASVNFGPRGTHLNLGLPGTGIGYRTRLDVPGSEAPRYAVPSNPQWQNVPDIHNQEPTNDTIDVIHFKSVDAASLGSGSLERVSSLLEKLQRQRTTVASEIKKIEREIYKAKLTDKLLGWIRRWIAPEVAAEQQQYVEQCSEYLDALKEINTSLVLNVEFAISDEAKNAFTELTNAFNRVSGCTRIWDITFAQAVDRYRTRSAASQTLDMRLVSFDRSEDSLMATEFKPPYFRNANGADLLLYPAFVAARAEGRFALLDIRKIDITSETTQFIVHDRNVPSDAEVVGNTWQYVNKDGNPDRRFSNNPGIPVAQYCQVFFKGEGLNEAWMVSNAQAGVAFGEAFRKYQNSLTDAETEVEGIAPPTADEWPELDLPDRPTPPPIDWKTYSGLVVIACLLILVLRLPFSLIEERTNLQNQRTIAMPADVGKRSADSSSKLSEMQLTVPEIAEIQQFLQSEGFDPGPADGKAGARTHKALSDWAKQRGFENPKFQKGTLELVRREHAARQVVKTPGKQLVATTSIPTGPHSLSSKPVSLINRAGETIDCPVETIVKSDSKGCIGNAERQGFVRMPEVSAGIFLDWNSKPVKVVQVRGAAAEAGLQAGDLLVELDGNKIIEPISLFKIIGKKQPGDYVVVRVVRGGKPINLTYQLMAKR